MNCKRRGHARMRVQCWSLIDCSALVLANRPLNVHPMCCNFIIAREANNVWSDDRLLVLFAYCSLYLFVVCTYNINIIMQKAAPIILHTDLQQRGSTQRRANVVDLRTDQKQTKSLLLSMSSVCKSVVYFTCACVCVQCTCVSCAIFIPYDTNTHDFIFFIYYCCCFFFSFNWIGGVFSFVGWYFVCIYLIVFGFPFATAHWFSVNWSIYFFALLLFQSSIVECWSWFMHTICQLNIL